MTTKLVWSIADAMGEFLESDHREDRRQEDVDHHPQVAPPRFESKYTCKESYELGVTLNVEEARLVRLAIFGPLLGPLAVKYSLHFGQLSDVPRFWIWVLVVILGIVGAIVGVLWEFRGTVRESGGGQVRTGIAAGSIGLGLILANLSSNAVLLGIGLLGFMCLIAASVNALTHYVLRYVNFSRRVD